MPPFADALAFLMAASAAIVGVGFSATVRPRAGHAGTAGSTDGNTREQGGTVHDARRRILRTILLELRQNAFSDIDFNQNRYRNWNSARRIVLTAIARVPLPVRPQPGGVAGVGQNLVNWSDAEWRSAPGSVAVAVEPGGGLLHSQRAGRPVAFQVNGVDEFDGLSFDGVNGELLLDLLSAAFGFANFVAKRRCCPIPEALLGRFAHRTRRVLTNLTRGVLIEDRSEEHTSELQSRQYLVCRLLLEKKKPNKQIRATKQRACLSAVHHI